MILPMKCSSYPIKVSMFSYVDAYNRNDNEKNDKIMETL
jgi:hypothetical protein